MQWAAVQGAESYSVEMRSDAGLSLSLSVVCMYVCVVVVAVVYRTSVHLRSMPESVYESVCV